MLATVMFTDIAASTDRVAKLGDQAWKELVERHHTIVRTLLIRFHGAEGDTAGDGFLATFDGPGRAIRCAQAITSAASAIGLQIRAGIHTGECELIDGKVGGINVIVGARVAAFAEPGDVLVTRTVKDLVAGSGARVRAERRTPAEGGARPLAALCSDVAAAGALGAPALEWAAS